MEKYLNLIKYNSDILELKEISYKALLDPDINSKDHNTICACCAWKQTQLYGGDIESCAKALKLSKRTINKIK